MQTIKKSDQPSRKSTIAWIIGGIAVISIIIIAIHLTPGNDISTNMPANLNPTGNIISPNSSDKWDANTSHFITWQIDSQVQNVDIYLYATPSIAIVNLPEFQGVIASDVPDNGSYKWKVTADVAGPGFQIGIFKNGNISVIVGISSSFTINPTSSISNAYWKQQIFLISVCGVLLLIMLFASRHNIHEAISRSKRGTKLLWGILVVLIVVLAWFLFSITNFVMALVLYMMATGAMLIMGIIGEIRGSEVEVVQEVEATEATEVEQGSTSQPVGGNAKRRDNTRLKKLLITNSKAFIGFVLGGIIGELAWNLVLYIFTTIL